MRAAGLYLAALYLREGDPQAGPAIAFGGRDRLVSQYLESEFLARISRRQRASLTRTAVPERMCGPPCEAVLELPGCASLEVVQRRASGRGSEHRLGGLVAEPGAPVLGGRVRCPCR